jgi:DNA-binding beta-propeller fold protein YncE
MRWLSLPVLIAAALVGSAAAQQPPAGGPYKVIKTAKVGGAGGFDYVYADSAGRRLYIPRMGAMSRVTVFNLDTLEPAGEIPGVNARGAVVDPKSNHGFVSSKPVAMWDAKTLAVIKTIDVEGNPDGILLDSFNDRVYVFSHIAPNATVIEAKDVSLVGTIDLGGAPEQAASDGQGHLYVTLEDKDSVAVVDARTLKVTGHFDLGGQAKTPVGLALDRKNRRLFVACRSQMMLVLGADDGHILATLPIGAGVDGALFNPATMEAFSSQGDGTLTVIKEESPTSFAVEQTVETMRSARTLTLDTRSNRILLIGAEFGPPAAPAAPGGRAGRGQMVPDSFSILVVGR